MSTTRGYDQGTLAQVLAVEAPRADDMVSKGPSQVMTVNEVAALLRIDRATVYRQQSMLGGVKIGRVLRFSRKFIENGIWGNRVGLQNGLGPLQSGSDNKRPKENGVIQHKNRSQEMGSRPKLFHVVASRENDPYGLVGS